MITSRQKRPLVDVFESQATWLGLRQARGWVRWLVAREAAPLLLRS